MTVLTSEPRHHATQKERVKEILRARGMDGVCSLLFYQVGLPNGRNRVQELRDDDGLDIETIACDDAHDAGTPAHVRYRWWWNKARQLRLMDPVQIGKKGGN